MESHQDDGDFVLMLGKKRKELLAISSIFDAAEGVWTNPSIFASKTFTVRTHAFRFFPKTEWIFLIS